MCYSILVETDLRKIAAAMHADIDEHAFETLYSMREAAVAKAAEKEMPAKDEIHMPEDSGGRIYPSRVSKPRKSKSNPAPKERQVLHFAPVVIGCFDEKNNTSRRKIVPMAYQIIPPAKLFTKPNYTFFNFRWDNTGSRYWSDAFKKHHGVVVYKRFYESVEVADLLKAGVVKKDSIEKYFREKMLARKKKYLQEGKMNKYKPTKAEQSDIMQRSIEIFFEPKNSPYLISPVIFTVNPWLPETPLLRFALGIDEPNAEVRAAGHDRTPKLLDQVDVNIWNNPEAHSTEELLAVGGREKSEYFTHQLAANG